MPPAAPESEPRSSSEEYYRDLYKAIRNGHHDPDLWLNPETDQVEPRKRREVTDGRAVEPAGDS